VKKLLVALWCSALSLYAADIFELVKLLDNKETAAFEAKILTQDDANTAREDNNKTILMYACWVGNLDAAKHLIAKGADVNAVDSGGATPLHLAIWRDHNDIALYLLEKGASTSALSKEGMSPLDIAIMRENRPIIEAIEKAAPKLKKLL
jgi:uncharacterized protein